VPLYVIIISQTVIWIYSLVMFSTHY